MVNGHKLSRPLSYSSLVQLGDDPDPDDLLQPQGDTGHPEDVDVTSEEMSLYSSIVSAGENVSNLKPKIEKKKQVKLNEDNAIAVYQNEISQLGAQEGENILKGQQSQQTSPSTDSNNQKDSQQPTSQAQLPSFDTNNDEQQQQQEGETSVPAARPGYKKTSSEIQNEKDEMMKKVEQVNTKVWAKVDLDAEAAKSVKQTKSQKNELAKQLKSISREDYNKMFHQATLQANAEVEGKSFQDLQEEDVQTVEQNDQKEQEKEQENEKVLADQRADPLNKEGSQMSGENPESMGDMNMEQAMSYANQATDQATTFNEEQVKETEKKKTKSKKDSPQTQDPQSTANKGSFYEQILQKSLAADPNAINVLSNLNVQAPQANNNKSQEKQQPSVKDKNIYEQLWERNNPDAAKKVVFQTQEEKQKQEFQQLKDSQQLQMDALLSLTAGE